MKTIIEKYIQTAIDNGLKYNNIRIDSYYIIDSFMDCELYSNYPDISLFGINTDYVLDGFPFIELITSKEFIDAIVKYMWSNIDKICHKYTNTGTYAFYRPGNKYIEQRNGFGHPLLRQLQDLQWIFTNEQAIAIRDGRLEDFMTNILGDDRP